MSESNIEFKIVNDKLVRYTPFPECGENVYKTDVIIDKDTFLKCLKEWTNDIDINEDQVYYDIWKKNIIGKRRK